MVDNETINETQHGTGQREAAIDRMRVAPSLCTLFFVMVGCGGGGGDEVDFVGIADADATGIWTGSDARDGRATVPVTIVVADNGRLASISTNLYLTGTGSTLGNSFTASATGFAPTGETFANGSRTASFNVVGTVFEGGTLSGGYSGANESGTLDVNYNTTKSNKSASLLLVAGSYTTAAGNALSISGSDMTFNSSSGPNCIGNGTIQASDPTRNVYQWTMTMTGCTDSGTANGVGYLEDAAPGTNNRLVLLGSIPTAPLIIVATK